MSKVNRGYRSKVYWHNKRGKHKSFSDDSDSEYYEHDNAHDNEPNREYINKHYNNGNESTSEYHKHRKHHKHRGPKGQNAIAIGQNAGVMNQGVNSFIIDASGTTTSPTITQAFSVDPIRSGSLVTGGNNALIYNTGTSEIQHTPSKTFVIQHPVYDNKYLVHACLEGPEAGVYYRGKDEIPEGSTGTTITLPYYASALAYDFTVHITPIYNGTIRILNVSDVAINKFEVYGNPGPFTWVVYGKRSSIDIEPNKSSIQVMGNGPYKWIA